MDIEYREQNYHIRTVIEEDKENFMSIRRETSDLSHAYDTIPGFLDQAWGFVLNGYDEVSMVAFRNGCFVAICTFHDFQAYHRSFSDDLKNFIGKHPWLFQKKAVRAGPFTIYG